MKLLIEKKSGKKFPPPFDGEGYTAIAVGLCENGYDPKHRQAYVLENGQFVNCDQCYIIKNFENPQECIFDDANFGDRFRTRDGRLAIYIGKKPNYKIHYLYIEGGTMMNVMPEEFYSDGRFLSEPNKKLGIDIVKRVDEGLKLAIIKEVEELESLGWYINAKYINSTTNKGYICEYLKPDNSRYNLYNESSYKLFDSRWDALAAGVKTCKNHIKNEDQE